MGQDVVDLKSWINYTEVHPSVYVVRFLNEPSDLPYAPFSGVCTVVFGRRIAELHAMQGKIRRQHIRDMGKWLKKEGIFTVLAKRAEGHRLPGAVERPDGWMSIDLVALGSRL